MINAVIPANIPIAPRNAIDASQTIRLRSVSTFSQRSSEIRVLAAIEMFRSLKIMRHPVRTGNPLALEIIYRPPRKGRISEI